jgi:simple sugar transport system permease protein
MGALLSAVVMIYLGGKIPSSSLFIIMFIVSCAAGALWAAIPAYFRAKWKTNETLFTLMMNYVAIDIVDVCTNTWRGSKSSMGQINAHTKAGWFPKVLGYRFTISILIVLALAIIIELYLNHSKHGYELSVLGESEDTARYAGINVQKVIVRTMLMSGAICGIAGFITVAGTDMTVSSATARGFGFTAIIVTWLAGLKTPYMFGMSFLLIFLEKGASQISSAYSSLNDYSTQVITGIILFFILGSEFFVKYKLVRRKKETAKKGGDSK